MKRINVLFMLPRFNISIFYVLVGNKRETKFFGQKTILTLPKSFLYYAKRTRERENSLCEKLASH